MTYQTHHLTGRRSNPHFKGHAERCFYCDRMVFAAGSSEAIHCPECQSTRDHYIPYSITNGDGFPPSRVVTACRFCNQLKGDAPPSVFEWFLRNCVATKDAEIRSEWRRFRYLLQEAGFRAAFDMARPKPKAAAPSRDPKGRYTKLDRNRDRARAR